MKQPEYVWMIEDGVRAELISLNAHTSVVRFTLAGTVHIVVVLNDEYEFIGEEYDDDED